MTARAGVVWHTQGSGKSLEMLFYVGKVMRDPAMANPTAVLITDRNDLDDQLFDEVFAPARTLPETPVQASSRDHLRTLLGRRRRAGSCSPRCRSSVSARKTATLGASFRCCRSGAISL